MNLMHWARLRVLDHNRREGVYSVRAFGVTAVVSEIPGNPAMSVTNNIEELARAVCHYARIGAEELVLFERYPKGLDARDHESVDRVSFHAASCFVHQGELQTRFTSPTWRPATAEEIEQLNRDGLICIRDPARL